MKASVEITGLDETQASLDRIADQADSLAAGFRSAEQIILISAQGKAPRRTGRLAASGHVAGDQGKASVQFGGPQVPYAGPIHWGWKARNIKANPFLLKATQATEPAWLHAYETHLAALINRETA
jgi:hypothetical protein